MNHVPITTDDQALAKQLRGKQIAFSGFMACGKSTAVESLARRIESCGVKVHVTRYRPLYPTFHIPTWRGGRRGRPASGVGGSNGVANKLQPAKIQWDKRFTVVHFLNSLCASAITLLLRMTRRRSVTLFDRYSYDYFIHYQPSGVWYRLAQSLAPKPDMAFLLRTRTKNLVQRTEERCHETADPNATLNEEDREALRLAQEKYEQIADQWPQVVTMTMNDPKDHEIVWQKVHSLGSTYVGCIPMHQK